MIRGVIFDMDGLMFDTERLSMQMWGRELAKQGFRYTNEVGNSIRGRNGEAIRRILEETYGPGFDFISAMQGVRADMMQRVETTGVDVKEGLYQLMDWLEEQKIPMAVASSSRRVSVETYCRSAGILERFRAIICGDQVRHSKPDPEIFYLAAEALGVKPGECLVLEDSFNGVRAGAAGGFITVMVPDLDQPTPEIDALYTRRAESLTEVLSCLKAGELPVHDLRQQAEIFD